MVHYALENNLRGFQFQLSKDALVMRAFNQSAHQRRYYLIFAVFFLVQWSVHPWVLSIVRATRGLISYGFKRNDCNFTLLGKSGFFLPLIWYILWRLVCLFLNASVLNDGCLVFPRNHTWTTQTDHKLDMDVCIKLVTMQRN